MSNGLSEKSSGDLVSWILAAITIFFWGITFVCTKTLLQSFSPLEILFIRYFLGYLFLWVLYPKRMSVRKGDNLLFAFAGLAGVTVYQFSENIAISYTTASNVSIIVAISPMWTALFLQLFLKSKEMNRWFVAGFIISIAGIALVSFNGELSFGIHLKGDLIALGSAISWGLYSVFLSVLNRRGYHYIGSSRRMFFFALLFMLPLAAAGTFQSMNGATAETSSAFVQTILCDWSPAVNAARFSDFRNIACLAFLGILASGFCFMAWNKACAGLGTVKATIGLYLIPVVTTVFAFFVLGETISLMGAAGIILTIAGLVISGQK
ncbi:MAG: DMT family transporter [Treponema sp.]|nr:DMT family transporter [Candidatus Treponema caballi]